jgi:hypothetical protein
VLAALAHALVQVAGEQLLEVHAGVVVQLPVPSWDPRTARQRRVQVRDFSVPPYCGFAFALAVETQHDEQNDEAKLWS